MPEQRFAQEELRPIFHPPIRHFKPEKGHRDRFGDRVFSSRKQGILGLFNFGYLDREGQKVKAGLLVSSDGEQLLKAHPNLLNNIDQALIKLTKGGEYVVNLGRNITLEDSYLLPKGGQSRLFLLKIEGNKYVIKMKSDFSRSKEVSQPYINEMLLSQSLQTDLDDKLINAGFVLPTFLFASGQVLCRTFAEGIEITDSKETRKKVDKLACLVDEYRRDHSKDPLWKNIYFDFVDMDTGRYLRTNNFIQREDGKIVWIDPFTYLK